MGITLVTSATFRNPGPLAIAVAGVDQMSGGRVELGLGAPAGAGRVYFQILDFSDLDHLQLLAEEVIPHLS